MSYKYDSMLVDIVFNFLKDQGFRSRPSPFAAEKDYRMIIVHKGKTFTLVEDKPGQIKFNGGITCNIKIDLHDPNGLEEMTKALKACEAGNCGTCKRSLYNIMADAFKWCTDLTKKMNVELSTTTAKMGTSLVETMLPIWETQNKMNNVLNKFAIKICEEAEWTMKNPPEKS